jgi:hypothetical protein
MDPSARAAFGFALHTGWGVAALVAGGREAPRLVSRQRVDLEPDGYAVQMFHAASDLDLESARRLVDGARSEAEAAAARALSDLSAQAAASGLSAVAVGLAAEPRPTLDDLEKILAVHPRMHRAEGDLYRDALVDAAGALRLPLTLFPPRQLRVQAASALGSKPAEIDRLLATLGQSVGAPWQQDHKMATLAALVALHGG